MARDVPWTSSWAVDSPKRPGIADRAEEEVAVKLAFVVTITLAAMAATASAQGVALHIEASFQGYALIWPTERCCAFSISLEGNGSVVVVVDVANGPRPEQKTYRYRVTTEEVNRISASLEAERFFDLPSQMGSVPVDGDERRIRVRSGSRAHQLRLGGPGDGSEADAVGRRAERVWRAIRAVLRTEETVNADEPRR